MKKGDFLLLTLAFLVIALGMAKGVLTAQAAETVLVHEEGDRLAVIYGMSEDGHQLLKFTEGRLMADGMGEVFCIDLSQYFTDGRKTVIDASTRMEAEEIEDVALHLEYVLQMVGDRKLSEDQGYIMRQLLVWRRFNELYNWHYGEIYVDEFFLPLSEQKEIFSAADRFYEEQKGNYDYGGYIFDGAGQNTAMFWATPVTDENGRFFTSAGFVPHTQNTNEGSSSADGVWFGGGEPDDSLGALPYDTYRVEEQACQANEGYLLIEPFLVTITEDQTVVPLGTLINCMPEKKEDEEFQEDHTEDLPEEIHRTALTRAPKTGDTSALIFWVILAVLGLVVVGACVRRFICGKMFGK